MKLPVVLAAVAAVAAVSVVAVTAAAVPSLTIRDDAETNGRKAWVLDNGTLRVWLLRSGGHIADVRLRSTVAALDNFSPMFVPTGNGYMGHMVCFPHYGPASADERQNGLRGHGEAGTAEWRQTRPPRITDTQLTFFYGADLPKTQYTIERAVTLRAGETSIHVQEWVENLAVYDRPYNYQQHATFGAPFVAPDNNVLDMSATRGLTDPKRTAKGQWATDREFTWPNAPRAEVPATSAAGAAASTISLREFRAVPDGQSYTPVLDDSTRELAWFTLLNRELQLLVGYVFPRADHPWIVDWQNQPRADTPAGMARGIEFGTSPFDEGLRNSVTRATLFGAPTYRWIGSRQRLSTTFTMFLVETGRDFSGVQDVQIGETGKRIQLTQRGGGGGLVVSGVVGPIPENAPPATPAPAPAPGAPAAR